MARFIFGLNTEKAFADISDTTESLRNLGVDVRDIDVIRGIADLGMQKEDLITISNLDFDAKKELLSVNGDLTQSLEIINTSITNRQTIPYDFIVDNVVRGASFKYNYIDYNDNYAIKGADISTSRLSSWSSFANPVTATSPIFYGGDLIVNPTPATSQSQLDINGLDITDAPIPRKYAAEVPTHLITMEIGGVPKQFYAMQGIPIEFTAFFRTATLSHNVVQVGTIRPTWEIENLDDGRIYSYQDVSPVTSIGFSDFKARERIVRFYYPPDQIRSLSVSRINTPEYPGDILEGLTSLNISSNLIEDLPDYATITPNLVSIDMSYNPLYNGADTEANVELNKLPTSISTITAIYNFRDSTPIDLSAYTNLTYLRIQGTYSGTYMRDTAHTPIVNSSSIQTYFLYGHVYTQLHTSVTSSTSLRYVQIEYNNITADSNGNPISFPNADNLQSFWSLSNSHNVVDVSGKENFTTYLHRYSRGLVGDRSIEGKFTNCNALSYVNFYATDADGDMTNAFSSLPSLSYLDLRYTRIWGRLTPLSFSGTSNLRQLYLAGPYTSGNRTLGYNTAGQLGDFFDDECFLTTPVLYDLIVISNGSVQGDLPTLTENRSLWRLYVAGTGITGGLNKQSGFNNNKALRYIYLHANRIYETCPQINSETVYRIYLYNNRIYGALLPFTCPSLQYFYIQNNDIGRDENGVSVPEFGTIPTFAGCPNLIGLNLSNNNFTSYFSGSFAGLTRARAIDVSNNNLKLNDGYAIINDLYQNWTSNQRGGVTVNLTGNAGISEAAILNNQVFGEYLTFLRSRGWSITF